MSEVLVANHLSRWYGDVIGLNDVSATLGPGITGLLGPNGAGKSSFLRIAAGEIRPSAGDLLVFGERPFANRPIHARTGYAPEGDRFFDEMRAREWLFHLLRLSGYGRAAARTRAEEALAEVGMEGSMTTRLGACSKGMRQRIKLAQAIAHDPDLLLLDEPMSGLDPMARRQARDLIIARAEAGATVLVSSHVLHEVESLTHQILLINKGRIAATGQVEEIRSVLDRHPHRIRIECDGPRRLAALLVDRAEVRSLRFEESAVLVETLEPVTFYGLLPGLVVEHELEITGLSSLDDRLEAVFDLLVNAGGPA